MGDLSELHERATSKKGLFWGFSAQVLSVGLWLIMLPIILRFMSRAAVGVWFVFLSVSALVQLLEMGFQYVLARNFSYVYAGAKQLHASGLEQGSGPLDEGLLHMLLAASRRIYLVISALAVLAFGVAGTAYVYSIAPAGLRLSTVLWSWAAFSASYVITLYFGYFNAVLQGRGDIQISNQITVVAKATQLVVSLVLVSSGLGLLGLGIGVLASAVVSRYLALRCVYVRSRSEMKRRDVPDQDVKTLITTLWHNASRYGVVLVGAFLIAEANVLIAASRIGVVQTASYSLAVQIFMVAQTVALLPFNLLLPRLSHLQAIGDNATTYKVFSTALTASLLLFVLIALTVLGAASPLLTLIGTSTPLPARGVLALMAVVSLLELNHGMCGNFIATRNEIPFARAALVTGVCVAVLGWIVAPRWGIAGVVAATGACQLAYNNWKWPHVAAGYLADRFPRILLRGLGYLAASVTGRRSLDDETQHGVD